MPQNPIDYAAAQLQSVVRTYANYPIQGVDFKDMMPVFTQPAICQNIIDALCHQWQEQGIQAVCGIESRGFFFGLPLAMRLGVPFVAIRKMGKLPGKTINITYNLEYGSASIELQADALPAHAHVLLHDDLLATGGTALAAAHLVQLAGAHVAGFSFLINLPALQGLEKLKNITDNTKYLINC
jgi:adenine phosphoribosyltransferase